MKNNPLKISEFSDQCLFVEYLEILKSQGKVVMYTAIPNSTWTPSWGQKIKNKKAGLNPGFPDLFIIIKDRFNDFKAICIEMKIKGGRLSKEQEAWHIGLVKAGVITWTAWGYDHAKEIIDNEL